MSEINEVASWIFNEEVPVPADIQDMLVPGEEAFRAFKTIRDIAIFTNKRLIVRDSQGLTGKKIEIYSLPYRSITMWSTENAGRLDLTSEIELWTRAGHIKISLGRKVDVREFDDLLARVCL